MDKRPNLASLSREALIGHMATENEKALMAMVEISDPENDVDAEAQQSRLFTVLAAIQLTLDTLAAFNAVGVFGRTRRRVPSVRRVSSDK